MNAAVAQLGFGQVRHTRHRPRHHAFAYATCFLMLPMRSLRAHGPGALARNRSAALSFHDTDHGDGRADSLGWLDEVLHQHGIHDAQGEVWLHTYPRMLGYSFKPVSFWYCHRADGSLRAVLAEVNNTFGERHCYLLDAPRYGQPCEAAKVFHSRRSARCAGATVSSSCARKAPPLAPWRASTTSMAWVRRPCSTPA